MTFEGISELNETIAALCEQIAKEEDPVRLLQLATDLQKLAEQKAISIFGMKRSSFGQIA